jgi:putative ABC transport system substrate-binding protein
MRRIGILLHGVQTDPLWQKRLAAFLEELEGLAWLENRNVHIEVQYSANNYDRLPGLAREIVTLNPDVIFANTRGHTTSLT